MVSLPYHLKQAKIRNFQCIKSVSLKDIPADTQFIVFTGENGDGKTSVLQALSLGLHNSEVLSDKDRGKTTLTLCYSTPTSTCENQILEGKTDNPFQSLDAFAAYGASRLNVSERQGLENPLYKLFHYDVKEANIASITETWLRDAAVNEPEKYEQVKKMLISLLPNVDDIVKTEPSKTVSNLEFLEKGNKLPLAQLSAGHKSILLMVGDMLMRLWKAQPQVKHYKDLGGIVLIDELEAHLHPKWQIRFPQLLAETFPLVQFVITTHSAICLLGMPQNTVVCLVKRTQQKGTEVERLDLNLKNLLPHHILTSPLFEMEEVKSVQNKDWGDIHTENNFQEIIKREEVRKELRQLLKTKYNA